MKWDWNLIGEEALSKTPTFQSAGKNPIALKSDWNLVCKEALSKTPTFRGNPVALKWDWNLFGKEASGKTPTFQFAGKDSNRLKIGLESYL